MRIRKALTDYRKGFSYADLYGDIQIKLTKIVKAI